MSLPSWKQWRLAHALLAITFLTSGLFLNAIQALLFYLVRPASKWLFRKLNYYVNYSLYCQMVFFAQYWGDVRLTTHIDKDDYDKYYGKEHGYLIMNHTYEIDWLVGWILTDNVRLLGNCKTYGKKSIQYVPTLGYAWKFGESVFLERNWDKDKEIIGRQLRELVEYPDPIWLLLMAEGTRFTKEKHEASMAFAKERGLPTLKHHLVPRTRGFTSSLPYLRGKVPAIYNVTLAMPKNGVAPTLRNLLLGNRIDASMYMERIPIESIPEGEKEAAEWLHELYRKKDSMIESYHQTGDWFKQSGVRRVEGFPMPRRKYPLLNTLGWASIVTVFVGRYLLSLLLTGSLLGIGSLVLIIVAFLYLLERLMGTTQISKGSSYGASNPTTPTSNPH